MCCCVVCFPLVCSIWCTPNSTNVCLHTDLSLKAESSAPRVNPLFLSRLLHAVGHVAEQQMIHLEVNISTELKRRKMAEEEEEENVRRRKEENAQGDHSKTPKTAGPKRRPASAKKVLLSYQ